MKFDNKKLFKHLLVLFGVFLLYKFFHWSVDNKNNPYAGQEVQVIEKQSTQTIKNSGYDGSVYQVENYLEDNLKDPDSYKGMEWSKVIKVGEKLYSKT